MRSNGSESKECIEFWPATADGHWQDADFYPTARLHGGAGRLKGMTEKPWMPRLRRRYTLPDHAFIHELSPKDISPLCGLDWLECDRRGRATAGPGSLSDEFAAGKLDCAERSLDGIEQIGTIEGSFSGRGGESRASIVLQAEVALRSAVLLLGEGRREKPLHFRRQENDIFGDVRRDVVLFAGTLRWI